MSGVDESDKLQQATCEAIVMNVAMVIDGENPAAVQTVRLPNGPEVGRQITIDGTEKDGLMNRARFSVMNPDLAPAGEVARIEFEGETTGKFGVKPTYSIQSVRRQGQELVLLENFLAESAKLVREEDFRPIGSEEYARGTVLKTVENWGNYRAGQLRSGRAG